MKETKTIKRIVNGNVEYDDKKTKEKHEMRNVLLSLSGKLTLADDDAVIDMLRMYFTKEANIRPKVELMLKNMQSDWLLEITIDENRVMWVKDLAKSVDWIMEERLLANQKWAKHFGWDEERTALTLYEFYALAKKPDIKEI